MHLPIKETGPSLETRLLDYLSQRWNRRDLPHLFYHTAAFYQQLAENLHTLATGEHLDETQTDACLMAAAFLLDGMRTDYQQPEEAACRTCGEFLSPDSAEQFRLDDVCEIIRQWRLPPDQQDIRGAVLQDAFQSVYFSTDFPEEKTVYRLEMEFQLQRRYADADWEQLQLQRLLHARYHTRTGKLEFEKILHRLILFQEACVEETKKRPVRAEEFDSPSRLYQHLDRQHHPLLLVRTLQLSLEFQWRENREHTLRAAVLLSLSTLSLGGFLAFLLGNSSLLSGGLVTWFMLAVVLLYGGSLLLAATALMPALENRNRQAPDLHAAKSNILSYLHQDGLTQNQMEEAFDTLLRDEELRYGNLVREIYHSGKMVRFRSSLIRYSLVCHAGAILLILMLAIAVMTG